MNLKGEREYLIKWRAMTDRYNEWVRATDLHAPEAVRKIARGRQGSSIESESSKETPKIAISESKSQPATKPIENTVKPSGEKPGGAG